MSKNENNKSLAKDVGQLLLFGVPFLFIVIGGLIYSDGGFDGTIMEELYPALFFGFIVAFVVIAILGDVFPDYPMLRRIAGPALGTIMVILEMCHAKVASRILFGTCCFGLCLLGIVRWIQRKIK